MTSDRSSSQPAGKDTRSDSEASGNAKSKDSTPTATTAPTSGADANKSPRKRRKVNHGMLCSAAKFSCSP